MPFVLGVTATVSNREPTILLQMEGAWLARKGHAQLVDDPAFPPLGELLEAYLDGRGKVAPLRTVREEERPQAVGSARESGHSERADHDEGDRGIEERINLLNFGMRINVREDRYGRYQ